MMTRALITSGGGAKGAFTVGALIHLIKNKQLAFDIISGTSTGSFIAALAAAGEVDALRLQYLSVTPDDILNKQNIVNNILNEKPFLFKTTPLLELVRTHVTQAVFDKIMSAAAPVLCITAVSLQTGLATIFSNRDLSAIGSSHYKVRQFRDREDMIKCLLASGSQAGFTPPVEIDNEQFVDGGHRDVVPSRVVIDLAPDEVVVLSNNPSQQFAVTQKYTDVLNTIFRAITIFVQDVRENDMEILEKYCNAHGKLLVVIEPPSDLDEKNPTGLGFNPIAMSNWMILGETLAKAKLDTPVGPVSPIIV